MSALRLTELFDVTDKVVVITGGGRGIGKMMTDGFVQNGAKVYIASRDLEACQAMADELNAKGPGTCFALRADLVTEAACKKLAEEIAKQETKVDVFINNSGVGWGGDVEHHPEKAWSKVLAVNVTSPFHVTRYLLPLLDAAASTADAARVINIGSVAGLMPQQINTIAYDTSKAAIHHLTRVLEAKLSRRPNGGHILVNAIAPGLVPTILSKGIAYVTASRSRSCSRIFPSDATVPSLTWQDWPFSWLPKLPGGSPEWSSSDGGQVYTMETGFETAKL